VLPCPGVAEPARPFLVALLSRAFPERCILAVTAGVKAQESFHQDLTTWMPTDAGGLAPVASPGGASVPASRLVSSRRFLSELHTDPKPVQSPPHPFPLPPGGEGRGEGERSTPSVPAPSRAVALRRAGASRLVRSVAPPGDTTTAAHDPFFYPAWEILPHETKLPHADVISERLETLVALQAARDKNDRPPVIVANGVALLQRTFSPADLARRIRRVRRGDRLDPLDLVEWLEDQGYEPEAQVTQKGEIALRGGILDVYPPTSPWPVRLEFFGDELESLRSFDPLTQISREEIADLLLPPAGELGILTRHCPTPGRSARSEESPAADTPATLVDYLPRGTIIILSEPDTIADQARQYAQQVPAGDPFFAAWEELEWHRRDLTVLNLFEGRPFESTPSGLESGDGGAGIREDADADYDRFPDIGFTSLDAYRPMAVRTPDLPVVSEAQRREFFNQLHRWIRQDYAVHVFCNNEGERQRFEEIWKEYGLGHSLTPSLSPGGGEGVSQPSTTIGALTRGFLYEAGKVVVLTDAEIFGRYKVQRPRRLKSPHAVAARSALDINFTDLEEGDYVVHVQHGIGRYLGLKNLPASVPDPASGIQPPAAGAECLVIEYAATDDDHAAPKLYVPVSEAHLVSKYVGAGKARPVLNTLGGARWTRTKAQAEKAVRDLAGELLSIQAARESRTGHAFAPDAPWQREFEGAFIFEETPDQMKAILETKGDMEKPRPMDRLICGDVGFGKTEVAIRAAFKALMGGKQVAVLVPTTVLAQQHFNTFRERMADYPVRIELLSRFRSRREQQRAIKDLASGAVDIVVGTHRLVQDDVAFKDLGLVIIDEEQRFGVLQKEKFKQLRQLVDVLTLSATPIPRTLYLALTGARDMSTIQTPPQDRLPVETIVTAYDERVIRDAIQRELNRGGQVFFLHNRVMTIDSIAQKLKALAPRARIVVGHGQMHADDLEEVMTRFVNGEADLLLSTTIIESGLDIPNANTIIIDRADRFGLSDLYQLRGRVGRYKHQAYAYLLLPRHAGLLSDARKRISAIKQYSTLGSGFKIAMRDLEIRGAGNLLGPEQSGHITAVGFDLYCQLLKQSVAALKGEKVKPRVDVEVRLDFLALDPQEASAESPGTGGPSPGNSTAEPRIPDKAGAHVPHAYVSDPRQRIEIYRKLAQATDKKALEGLRSEWRDRFGPFPQAVELLLQVAGIRVLASDRGITSIEVKEDRLMLVRHGDYITLGGKFPRLTKKAPGARLNEIRKLLLEV
jgi:transcription-repair coupling factor (superfamily II helicase)